MKFKQSSKAFYQSEAYSSSSGYTQQYLSNSWPSYVADEPPSLPKTRKYLGYFTNSGSYKKDESNVTRTTYDRGYTKHTNQEGYTGNSEFGKTKTQIFWTRKFISSKSVKYGSDGSSASYFTSQSNSSFRSIYSPSPSPALVTTNVGSAWLASTSTWHETNTDRIWFSTYVTSTEDSYQTTIEEKETQTTSKKWIITSDTSRPTLTFLYYTFRDARDKGEEGKFYTTKMRAYADSNDGIYVHGTYTASPNSYFKIRFNRIAPKGLEYLTSKDVSFDEIVLSYEQANCHRGDHGDFERTLNTQAYAETTTATSRSIRYLNNPFNNFDTVEKNIEVYKTINLFYNDVYKTTRTYHQRPIDVNRITHSGFSNVSKQLDRNIQNRQSANEHDMSSTRETFYDNRKKNKLLAETYVTITQHDNPMTIWERRITRTYGDTALEQTIGNSDDKKTRIDSNCDPYESNGTQTTENNILLQTRKTEQVRHESSNTTYYSIHTTQTEVGIVSNYIITTNFSDLTTTLNPPMPIETISTYTHNSDYGGGYRQTLYKMNMSGWNTQPKYLWNTFQFVMSNTYIRDLVDGKGPQVFTASGSGYYRSREVVGKHRLTFTKKIYNERTWLEYEGVVDIRDYQKTQLLYQPYLSWYNYDKVPLHANMYSSSQKDGNPPIGTEHNGFYQLDHNQTSMVGVRLGALNGDVNCNNYAKMYSKIYSAKYLYTYTSTRHSNYFVGIETSDEGEGSFTFKSYETSQSNYILTLTSSALIKNFSGTSYSTSGQDDDGEGYTVTQNTSEWLGQIENVTAVRTDYDTDDLTNTFFKSVGFNISSKKSTVFSSTMWSVGFSSIHRTTSKSAISSYTWDWEVDGSGTDIRKTKSVDEFTYTNHKLAVGTGPFVQNFHHFWIIGGYNTEGLRKNILMPRYEGQVIQTAEVTNYTDDVNWKDVELMDSTVFQTSRAIIVRRKPVYETYATEKRVVLNPNLDLNEQWLEVSKEIPSWWNKAITPKYWSVPLVEGDDANFNPVNGMRLNGNIYWNGETIGEGDYYETIGYT